MATTPVVMPTIHVSQEKNCHKRLTVNRRSFQAHCNQAKKNGAVAGAAHARHDKAYFAPASNHFPITARSSSVIFVIFPNGMAFVTTTCW